MKKIIRTVVVFLLVLCMLPISSMQTEAKMNEKKGYVIKVNKGTNCVTIYDKKGNPIKAMTCSPGKATPIGTFYTPVKYRWHEMIGNCYAQYCTRITGNFLFHSVWYYRKGDKSSMSVRAYNKMGNKDSHGCVRLLCKDAKWIYENCALKTKVVIFNGTKKDDPLGKPSFEKIETGAFTSWDPTDPDPKNPYIKKRPSITPKYTTIEYNSKVTEKTAVTYKDYKGRKLTSKNAKITVKGSINTKKLGTYKVKYKVKTKKKGYFLTKTITFRVVDTKNPVLSGTANKTDILKDQEVDLLSGVTAKMVSGQSLTSKIGVSVTSVTTGETQTMTNGKVTFAEAGQYKVTYTVTGSNKKKTTKTVTYTVQETI